ncbi:MAG: hypothetical protein ACI9UK_000584, partial [Candidatus Krumholzibacteriia bacterium]
ASVQPAAALTASAPESFLSDSGTSPMGPDPDLIVAEVLAKPVPLVIEVDRDGKTWLLKSEGRNIALTLESLRRLRQVPGTSALRLRAVLPAAPVQKKRFFNRG